MIITWDRLDACETPDAIAALLRQYGIRGTRNDACYCPLARATGWRVDLKHATTEYLWRRLTVAQQLFLEDFDRGLFPDLIESENEQ